MHGLDHASHSLVTHLLASVNDMTLATLRDDGSPHATTVSFASDGLILFAAVAIDGGKAHDIRGDGRVSLTINAPYSHWREIQGLAMEGVASLIDWPDGQRDTSKLLLSKLPGYLDVVGESPPVPWPGMLFIRIVPTVLVLVDYTQRFGHTTRVELTGLA